MGRVEVGVGWIGSGMGIEWGGVGIGCVVCELDWGESCVLFRPHVLSVVSVSYSFLFAEGWAMVLGGGWCLKRGGGEVLRYQGGAVVSALVSVCGIESRRLVWLVLSLLAARGSHVLPVGAVVLLGCR